MGGQACVFYGAAQVSKDVDFVLLADEANSARLHAALDELQAERIAIPPFTLAVLERGHAVHYRCRAASVDGLRVDVMAKMRGVSDFPVLWERRTVFGDDKGAEFNLLSIPDLVQAKKTQWEKDWPMIATLLEIHYRENRATPINAHVEFWLLESRFAESLITVVHTFAAEAQALSPQRPLLVLAIAGDLDALRLALDTERQAEQARDRAYWEPLRRDLEEFRRAERA